jgi:tetratricopeptide (TPR) repeat protein
MFLAARGRSDASAIADRACDLDPLCFVIHTAAASVRYFAGDYSSAVARCRHTLEMDPTFGPARRRLAASLAELGRYDEALDEFSLITPSRLDPVSLAWKGHTLAVSGNKAAARNVAASLEQAADGRRVPPFHVAMLYAGLDDVNAAFIALERACERRDPVLDTLQVEPRFKNLRHDARYAGLLDRLRSECYG